MKKKSGSRIVRVFSRIFKLRAWFDWDRIKSFTIALKNGIKLLFVKQEATKTESFESAVSRMKLSDTELTAKQKALFRLSLLMLGMFVLIFGYGIYQLCYGTFKAFIVSLVVSVVAATLAFRYHFWFYQLKHRKLGCTFQEWFRQGLLGEKDE